jgi:hypothetical protein
MRPRQGSQRFRNATPAGVKRNNSRRARCARNLPAKPAAAAGTSHLDSTRPAALNRRNVRVTAPGADGVTHRQPRPSSADNTTRAEAVRYITISQRTPTPLRWRKNHPPPPHPKGVPLPQKQPPPHPPAR